MVNTEEIKSYMKKYFQGEWGDPLDQDAYEITSEGVVLTAQHVSLSRKIPGGKLKVKLSHAEGDLNVEPHVTSLVNMPHTVDGDFTCSQCKLTTLEGGPSHVGASYDCGGNKLTSLAHAPMSVGVEFACDNNLLTDLVNAPKCQILWAVNNPIRTLQGIPDHVGTVGVTWNADLPLLPVVEWNRELDLQPATNATSQEEKLISKKLYPIVAKYIGKGRAVMLNFALELKKHGFAGNARW